MKGVPITVETAHQFFSKRQMAFIVKMVKENYKQGFKNGMMLRKAALLLLLFTSLSFSQSAIVTSGDDNTTIGEVFPIM